MPVGAAGATTGGGASPPVPPVPPPVSTTGGTSGPGGIGGRPSGLAGPPEIVTGTVTDVRPSVTVTAAGGATIAKVPEPLLRGPTPWTLRAPVPAVAAVTTRLVPS